ncbi:PREDICTED: uncharacterized protein LOC108365287 [Rhagoletis zephyria]|uniref:uncharacterized protein LOC108365287 n=1 Tax=Rhagoletis zephyria TaxID=28612 RepID=UPI000811A7C0|nr:PREDICTED: uncharacterized protein LOC108365287 [Rhagoletis zephyria]
MALKMSQCTCFFPIMAFVIVVFGLIAPTNQERLFDSAPTQAADERSDIRSSSSGNAADGGDSTSFARHTEKVVKSVPYFQASLPMRVYECLRGFSILRCTKLFVLQKLEERKHMRHTGNLTRDFLDQFFDSDDRLGSLINNKYASMSDEKLNQCLVLKFQRFFKHRDIKLHFLPGIMVKIVPSRDNKLSFTLKKSKKSKMQTVSAASGRASKLVEEIDETLATADVTETQADEFAHMKQSELGGLGGAGNAVGGVAGGVGGGHGAGGGGGAGGIRRKNKKGSYSSYKNTILQMAVPVMVMPAILMGTVLPFLLPMLKMATIMTMMLNNSAFIAALIYAARTHANAQEEQHISYPPQGYF